MADDATTERTPTDLHIELHGNGLSLLSWDSESDADVETWLRGLSDPELRRWNTPLKLVTDLDDARESLRARARGVTEGERAAFRVTDPDSGTTLGHIGVDAINYPLSYARVGYWVLPEARGHRVAPRSLALVASWYFRELGLQRLELGHAVGHDISCRVAERCGFRYEGTMRGATFEAGRHDAFRDAHLHARIATDPEPTAGLKAGGA